MSKEKKENPLINFNGEKIDLVKFSDLDDKEQYSKINDTLKEIYKDNLDVTRKHVMKVLRLTWNTKDDFIYLPYNLRVSKNNLGLSFEVGKKKPIPIGWLIFLIWLLCFALIGATYAGFKYLSLKNLNKDIDGDGIADINIDLDDDGKADINIDTNGDEKPELNIDYRHNLKATFNIDKDGDGFADFNMVNDATENRKECKINCDTDGDGWPETNIDLDSDGVPDTNIDVDGDGVPDLNLDIDGDGKCDLMCDTDNDGKCDEKCIKPEDGLIDEDGNINSGQNGDSNIENNTPSLMINFIDGEEISADNLFPDDQPGIDPYYPTKTFYVENLSTLPIRYSLVFVVDQNSFITSNLKFKLTGTNGGATFGYESVPLSGSKVIEEIIIPSRVTQKYTLTFKLQGTGTAQNEDQGRTYKGHVEIKL